MPAKKSNQVATVQSLDRGLAILQAIAHAPQPMSLGQVADLMGVDRSTAFRLLHTLKRRGFVAMLSLRKDYILGATIWTLHNHHDWNKMLAMVARDQLKLLAVLTNETAHIAIREGKKALSIDCAPASHMVAVSSRIGELFPLHCTAHGKALLADTSEQDLNLLFGSELLTKFTKVTISTLPELARDIVNIRALGYATDEAEFSDEVRCIAAPIRLRAEIVGSIGISVPALRVSSAKTCSDAKIVCEIAAHVSELLNNRNTEEYGG